MSRSYSELVVNLSIVFLIYGVLVFIIWLILLDDYMSMLGSSIRECVSNHGVFNVVCMKRFLHLVAIATLISISSFFPFSYLLAKYNSIDYYHEQEHDC